MSEVILVDTTNQPVGTAEKMIAHRGSGQLHRAFSVFLFNGLGDMLLQQRAREKYHFGGLWTNACCSHPTQGVEIKTAAEDRLIIEMGLKVDLQEKFTFQYRAHDPKSKLTEWEIDHVFVGFTDDQPQPNPKEVNAWGWITLDDLFTHLENGREAFTPWFPIAIEELKARDILKQPASVTRSR